MPPQLPRQPTRPVKKTAKDARDAPDGGTANASREKDARPLPAAHRPFLLRLWLSLLLTRHHTERHPLLVAPRLRILQPRRRKRTPCHLGCHRFSQRPISTTRPSDPAQRAAIAKAKEDSAKAEAIAEAERAAAESKAEAERQARVKDLYARASRYPQVKDGQYAHHRHARCTQDEGRRQHLSYCRTHVRK